MNVVGTSRLWVTKFKNVHDVLVNAIVRCWPACRARCKPTTLEDEITRKLVIAMRKDTIIRSSPFFIESQLELLPEDLKGNVGVKGYLDIAVLFSAASRKLYMAFECKRLNVSYGSTRRRSLATEYVLQGMMRFVRAQYAKNFPTDAMVGYVMDGDTSIAQSAITKRIKRYKRRLHCRMRDLKPGLPPSAMITTHSRSCGDIHLSHLLVPFS
jgi:hypothetical protein